MWQIEVYENGLWIKRGQPSSDFHKLYAMCTKYCENGQKARVVKV